MRRLHAIAISILLGAGIAAGAAASLRTVHLGAAAAATSATVPEKTIAARHAKLAKWSASLQEASTAKPPALPKVPHYAPVPVPTMPPIQSADAPTHTATQARQVVEHPTTTTPPKPAAKPAGEQVTYVQPPPIVRYQQAPALATPTTTASGEHEDGYDDGHSESSQQESAQGGAPAGNPPTSGDGEEGDG